MKKRVSWMALATAAFLLLFGAAAVLLWRYSPVAGYGLAGVWLAAVVFYGITVLHYRRNLRRMLAAVIRTMDPRQQRLLAEFPLPAMAVSATGEVLFCNDRLQQEVLCGEPAIGIPVCRVFPGLTVQDIARRTSLDVQHGDLRLTAYVNRLSDEHGGLYVLYFCDNTALKNLAAEYTATRPVLLLIEIDNLEESTRDLRDSDRSRIAGQVESMLDEWISSAGGVLRKYSTGRFMAVTENRALNRMTRERFSVLDHVRTAFPDTRQGITLSVGVGQGKTMQECERLARQALDMAQARGGDQVAVKTANGFDFYGGRSRGVERRTKVRTRVIAAALRELMAESDVVLVMGHRLSDLDSLGSAAALTVAARKLGQRAYAVVRRSTTMAAELIRRYEAAGADGLFVEPEDVIDSVTRRTLLIITDTHAQGMLDCPQLYQKASRVVVIDHHRKMVDHITGAALEYHEPSSSSACELVAELLPYMGEGLAGPAEAEALLAGIMLDTRNFVLRTGVRTFEAAAQLRRMGADTVSVKRMFADTLDMYRKKSTLVTRAVLFHRIAIAVSDEDFGSYRAAAAQAADEMLSVNDTIASFVVFRVGRDANISARSYGECNVQLIMESLGGGGHMTMAGTQLRDTPVAEAERRLREAIQQYLRQNENQQK